MSKANTPRALRELFSTDRELNRLRRSARHSAATEDLRAALPPAIAERVTLVRTDERIEILAETNATAQLARFHAPALEQRAGLPVRIRVVPRDEPGGARQAAPTLPAEGAACLRETAAAIDDPELAGALERLASRASEES